MIRQNYFLAVVLVGAALSVGVRPSVLAQESGDFVPVTNDMLEVELPEFCGHWTQYPVTVTSNS